MNVRVDRQGSSRRQLVTLVQWLLMFTGRWSTVALLCTLPQRNRLKAKWVILLKCLLCVSEF